MREPRYRNEHHVIYDGEAMWARADHSIHAEAIVARLNAYEDRLDEFEPAPGVTDEIEVLKAEVEFLKADRLVYITAINGISELLLESHLKKD